ncbi:hypothetical protein pb186bvf_009483 [Paramecium bursaria]
MKNFQILDKLGEGSYSTVLRVKRKSDSIEYAMKKVRMGQLKDKEKENSLNEIRILASIAHPNIVAYKEAFYNETSQSLCIIMEFANEGDLHERIKQQLQQKHYIQEREIWKMLYQISQALKTLHQMQILHRDLKSANVFIHDGEYKLGDMNVSKVAKNKLVYTQTGTPYYASPEVWRDQPYDAKSDMWSLGCVSYEMASLKPPFRAQNMEGLYKKVQKGLFERIPSKYSNDLLNIISLCLQVSPNLRPSAQQLIQNPIFIKNTKQFEEQDYGANTLLQTIKVPKNMNQLGDKLPRSKYEESNKSFDENSISQINSSFLPKIKPHFSVPPLQVKIESDRYHSMHQRKNILPQNPKISVVQSNAMPYINSSSAQLQNMYNQKKPLEIREQKQAQKPVWWG